MKGKVLMKIRVRPCGGARFAKSTMSWTSKKINPLQIVAYEFFWKFICFVEAIENKGLFQLLKGKCFMGVCYKLFGYMRHLL